MSGFRACGEAGGVAIICSPCAEHMMGQLLLGRSRGSASPNPPARSGKLHLGEAEVVLQKFQLHFPDCLKKMTSLRNGGGLQTEPKHVTPSLQRSTPGVRKNKARLQESQTEKIQLLRPVFFRPFPAWFSLFLLTRAESESEEPSRREFLLKNPLLCRDEVTSLRLKGSFG